MLLGVSQFGLIKKLLEASVGLYELFRVLVGVEAQSVPGFRWRETSWTIDIPDAASKYTL